jgi:hypothetical protein
MNPAVCTYGGAKGCPGTGELQLSFKKKGYVRLLFIFSVFQLKDPVYMGGATCQGEGYQ